MLESVIFRGATEKDFIVLAQMRWDYQFEKESVDPIVSESGFLKTCVDFMEAGVASGEWVIWVAEVDGIIISHVFLRVIKMLPKPHKPISSFGNIRNVYTRPEYRGQGVATELIKRVIDYSKNVGLEKLILWPSDVAVGLYQKFGFQVENEIMELIL